MKRILYVLMVCILIDACKEDDNGINKGEFALSTFKDERDGTVYKCITIGGDTWMAENLRYSLPGGFYKGCLRYSEGWGGMSQKQFDNYIEKVRNEGRMSEELYQECYSLRDEGYVPRVLMEMIGYKFPAELLDDLLSYDKTYVEKYGYLYTYGALDEAVPEGWRIPTDEDWKRLEETLGVPAAEAGTLEAWRGNGLAGLLMEGDQGIGFGAMYGGGKIYHSDQNGGIYDGKGFRATWWASDTVEHAKEGFLGMVRTIELNNSKVWRGTTKREGTAYSVRCIRK